MEILTFIKVYLVTVSVFFLIDLFWLGIIAKELYSRYIGNLLLPSPNWIAAIAFYLIFIVGLVIFAIYPALKDHSWTYALLYGAMFGFFTYMTYDLTNLAVLKDWSWQITLIDIAWGTFLAGSVSIISYTISSKFLGL